MLNFEKIKNNIVIFLGIVILLFIGLSYTSYKLIRNVQLENHDLISVLQNDIIKWKDKYNQEHTKVSVLEINNEKQFLKLQTSDSVIVQLQNLIISEKDKKKKVEVAVIIANNTIIKLQDSLRNVILNSEYVHNGDTVWVYPTYVKQINDSANWLKGTFTIGLKTSKLDLLVRNDYDFVLGKEKTEERTLLLWHKKREYAEITNHNPYTMTKTIKVYKKIENKSDIKDKTIPLGIGIAIGLLIHLL